MARSIVGAPLHPKGATSAPLSANGILLPALFQFLAGAIEVDGLFRSVGLGKILDGRDETLPELSRNAAGLPSITSTRIFANPRNMGEYLEAQKTTKIDSHSFTHVRPLDRVELIKMLDSTPDDIDLEENH